MTKQTYKDHGRMTNSKQKHTLSRRGLLRGLATAGGIIGAEGLIGLSGLSGDWKSLTKLASAQDMNGFGVTRDRYYIFCYF